ncbi:Bug family tripartite tricarboxylate transporter substrate binding protein [Variovorax sp. 22077]
MLGDEIAFALVVTPRLLPHITAGKIRALAVTQPRRSPLLAEVPTIGEAVGLELMQDVVFVAWQGMLTPAKAPAEAVERLQKSAAAALAQPAVRERLKALGTDPIAMPAGPFAQRMKNASEQYRHILQRFQIKANCASDRACCDPGVAHARSSPESAGADAQPGLVCGGDARR